MSLKNGDLKNSILPNVSVDEFNPKSGDENDVIVVAFYLKDKEPADDLNTFIQRGFIDNLDVEVSPSTDEDGHYLVFVEMSRDDSFPNKFQALLKDVENVSGKQDWEVITYLSMGQTFKFNDPELFKYIILRPESYVTKDKFNVDKIKENINTFFSKSMITGLTYVNNVITLTTNGKKIMAEVVDIGDYDAVIGRNFLSESAFRVGQNPYEAKVLENMLGNCQILPIGKYLCISRDDKVVLLSNTRLEY